MTKKHKPRRTPKAFSIKPPEFEVVAIPELNPEPTHPIVVEVNIEMHPRVPYFIPFSEHVFGAIIGTIGGCLGGSIVLALLFP